MKTKMDKRILLLSKKDSFSKHIELCLKQDKLNVNLSETYIEKENPSVVIVNLFAFDESIEQQLHLVLKSNVDKVIVLENALSLYLNSKNPIPFSVYTQLCPCNEICERCLEIEKKIIESNKKYVIFRISEMYGASVSQNLVEKMLFTNEGEFENSSHDFIYDGDVISAIEIALRKEVVGLFDIASGQTIELKKLVDLIKKLRLIKNLDIVWKRRKTEVSFNCDNFKYYKWEPLVNIELGLKTLYLLRRTRNG